MQKTQSQLTETDDVLIITRPTSDQRKRLIAALNEPAPATPETLTRKQAAKIFGVHPGSLKRWEKSGKLHPIKVTARTLRYDRREIDAILSGGAR
jgi:hypothetical protein